MMFIEFTRPWLLVLGVLIPVILYISYRGHPILSPFRRRIALFIRIVIVLFLILSLAGVKVRLPTMSESVFFLVDASDSITATQKEFVREYIQNSLNSMDKDNRAGIIVFGKEARVEFLPRKNPRFSRLHTEVNPQETNIQDALSLAIDNFPPGGHRRVILFTDGNQTLGEAGSLIDSLIREGIEVDVIPLIRERKGEILLERIVLPESVKKKEEFEIKVIARSVRTVEGKLNLYRNEKLFYQNEVTFQEGQNIFSFRQSLDEKGFYTYRASVQTWADTIPENNEVAGYTVVEGEPKVLLLTEKETFLPEFIKSPSESQFRLQISSVVDAPSTVSELGNYDAIILNNVSAFQLSSHQLRQFQTYVKDLGGGLLAIAGDNSFGLGGYQGTALEEVLPVYSGVQKKLIFPNVSVVLVIDKSGSMGGGLDKGGDSSPSESKLLLAKKAALAVVDTLTGYEHMGVISFDTVPRWTVPIQSVAERARIASQLASLTAGGGTSLFPALEEAFLKLKEEESIVKHVIVLSDGLSEEGEFERIVENMVQEKITVSTVAIGEDADVQLMRDIARWGKGKSYYTSDIHSLPRIFTTEVLRVSRSLTVDETFAPRINENSPLLSGFKQGNIPSLGGYVVTTAKNVSHVHLHSHRKDPLLATWRYGLGKAAAVTFDFNGTWSKNWQDWSGYPKIISRLINWVLPQKKDVLFPVVSIEEGKGHIIVDAINEEGEFINFLSLQSKVIHPGGEEETVSLVQSAPGRYEGFFSADDTGSYMISVFDRKGSLGTEITGAVVPYSSEYRKLTSDRRFLYQMVNQTGGRMLNPEGELPEWRGFSFSEPRQIWPLLVFLASFLFLADVGVRTVSSHIWKLLMKKLRLILREKVGAILSPERKSVEDYLQLIKEGKNEKEERSAFEELKSRTQKDESYYKLLQYMARRHDKEENNEDKEG